MKTLGPLLKIVKNFKTETAEHWAKHGPSRCGALQLHRPCIHSREFKNTWLFTGYKRLLLNVSRFRLNLVNESRVYEFHKWILLIFVFSELKKKCSSATEIHCLGLALSTLFSSLFLQFCAVFLPPSLQVSFFSCKGKHSLPVHHPSPTSYHWSSKRLLFEKQSFLFFGTIEPISCLFEFLLPSAHEVKKVH